MSETKYNKKYIQLLIGGFFASVLFMGAATIWGNKWWIVITLFAVQACATLLIREIALKEKTNDQIVSVIVFLNIIAFTSNIRILRVSVAFDLIMTVLQSVCAVLMGLYILSLCRGNFDITEDGSEDAETVESGKKHE